MPTPTPAPDHPANQVSNLLSEDFRSQLLKTPYALPLENQVYQARLKELRDNWKYGAIVQWCYLFKSIIKLTDHFDTNSFEEELLQLNPPTFITRLKTQLVYYLTGIRITNTYLEETGEFEEALKNIIPQYFLDKYESDAEIDDFQFARLSLVEQINIFYELINLANDKNESLRKLIDTKFEKSIEQTKPISILVVDKKLSQEEYLILPDLRLYFKELTFKKIGIPRKRSDLEELLKTKTIDELLLGSEPKITRFSCIASNLYEYDAFINSQSKNSSLYKSLKPYYDEIAENDIKLRKQELSRQRQIKLQTMMVHRKRSSRLEEKEKKRLEDEERERIEYEILRREAAANNAAKRMKLRGDEYISRESSAGPMSRELRYRKKFTDSENGSAAQTPDPEQVSENIAPDAQDDPSVSVAVDSIEPEQDIPSQALNESTDAEVIEVSQDKVPTEFKSETTEVSSLPVNPPPAPQSAEVPQLIHVLQEKEPSDGLHNEHLDIAVINGLSQEPRHEIPLEPSTQALPQTPNPPQN